MRLFITFENDYDWFLYYTIGKTVTKSILKEKKTLKLIEVMVVDHKPTITNMSKL